MLDYILIVWPYYLKVNTQIGFVVFQFQCFFIFDFWLNKDFLQHVPQAFLHAVIRMPVVITTIQKINNEFFTERRSTQTYYSNNKWIFSLC